MMKKIEDMGEGDRAIIELAITKDRVENNKYLESLVQTTKEEIIKRTNENCENTVKKMVLQMNSTGCQNLTEHKTEHKEKEKKFLTMITIIPAIITSIVLLGNWLKKIIIENLKS